MKMVSKNSGKSNNLLFYFALSLLVISAAVFLVNVSKFVNVTGKATGGDVNLTIEAVVNINFTTANITWGLGSVTPGETVASLDTAAGSVTNGNWTANSAGLILENIGNQNVSLELKSGKSATNFIGGSNGSEYTDGDYRINVSNTGTGSEAGSCQNETKTAQGSTDPGSTMAGGYNLSHYFNINQSNIKVCDVFFFNDAKDTIRIDINVNVSSASNITGTVEDTITATATGL